MAALARAGWTIAAAGFGALAFSVLHAGHTGWFPAVLLVFIVSVCAWRPVSGLEIVAAATPVSWFLMQQHWSASISWAEVIACAAIAGLSIDAVRRPRVARVAPAVAVPALIFGIVVASAIVASLAVKALTLGPAFWGAVAQEVFRDYFVDLAEYPGMHAGLLLIEGLLFFALAARVAAPNPAARARIVRSVVAGATLAGMLNISRLVEAALRSDRVLAALSTLAQTLRWNLEYSDYNAAGSYFVMALFLAVALVAAGPGLRRWWIGSLVVIAIALWLTGSRAAYVAGVLAFGAALAIRWTARERRRVILAGVVGLALLGGVTLAALASPRRGNQGTSGTAIDIRLEMALAGARMLEAHPAFGVGLAEFYQRSGEFVSQRLLREFPVSLHENAHNNFVQVAAELGVVGAIPFIWLIVAGLFVIARDARRRAASDPVPLVIVGAIASFVITWLGGHPLLIPEASAIFWIVFGTAIGAATGAVPGAAPPVRRSLLWWFGAAAAVAAALTMPLRQREMTDEAELEHVGIGVSVWQFSPDGIRCRSAVGGATIYVPTSSPFEFSVYPRTDHPVRLEMRLEGRLADVVSLAPGRWNDLRLPARHRLERARYAPLDLRVQDGDRIEIWLTKVRPLVEQ